MSEEREYEHTLECDDPDHRGHILFLRENRAALEAEIATAREALERYGRHVSPCWFALSPETRRLNKRLEGEPCTCGLTAALETGEVLPRPRLKKGKR